jgi:hypothetical protein
LFACGDLIAEVLAIGIGLGEGAGEVFLITSEALDFGLCGREVLLVVLVAGVVVRGFLEEGGEVLFLGVEAGLKRLVFGEEGGVVLVLGVEAGLKRLVFGEEGGVVLVLGVEAGLKRLVFGEEGGVVAFEALVRLFEFLEVFGGGAGGIELGVEIRDGEGEGLMGAAQGGEFPSELVVLGGSGLAASAEEVAFGLELLSVEEGRIALRDGLVVEDLEGLAVLVERVEGIREARDFFLGSEPLLLELLELLSEPVFEGGVSIGIGMELVGEQEDLGASGGEVVFERGAAGFELGAVGVELIGQIGEELFVAGVWGEFGELVFEERDVLGLVGALGGEGVRLLAEEFEIGAGGFEFTGEGGFPRGDLVALQGEVVAGVLRGVELLFELCEGGIAEGEGLLEGVAFGARGAGLQAGGFAFLSELIGREALPSEILFEAGVQGFELSDAGAGGEQFRAVLFEDPGLILELVLEVGDGLTELIGFGEVTGLERSQRGRGR